MFYGKPTDKDEESNENILVLRMTSVTLKHRAKGIIVQHKIKYGHSHSDIDTF